MSTSPLDYPVLISQLPIAGKLVNAEQLSPELRREMFEPLLQRQQHEDGEKVQEVEKKDAASTVTRDGRGGGQGHAGHRRGKKEAEPEPEETTSNASPWSGNIINVKI